MFRLIKVGAMLAVLSSSFAASPAMAAVLNLDFGPTPIGTDPVDVVTSPYHAVTPSVTNTTWNTTLGTSDVGSGLLWGDGTAATGVSYNLGRTLTGNTGSDLANQPGSSSALGGAVGAGIYASPRAARDGIFHTGGGNGVSLQFTGLPEGTYNIYYVGRNTNLSSGAVGTSQYTSDSIYAGTSASSGDFAFLGYLDNDKISYTSTNNATWVQGLNYAKTTVTVGAGEFLNLAFIGDTAANAPTDQRGFLNSLQLELVTAPVPEPSTYALLSLCGLVFGYRRFRSR